MLGLTGPSRGAGQRRLLAAIGVQRAPGQHHRRRALRPGHGRRHPRVPPRRGDARGGQDATILRGINLGGTRRLLESRADRRAPAVRLLQHHRHLRAPGAGRHQRGLSAPARATSTSGPRSLRRPWCGSSAPEQRTAGGHPAAGRRVRPARPAAAQALPRRGGGQVPAVRQRRGPASHGLRGRRRLGVPAGVRAGRGRRPGPHRRGARALHAARADRRGGARVRPAGGSGSGCRSRPCSRWRRWSRTSARRST